MTKSEMIRAQEIRVKKAARAVAETVYILDKETKTLAHTRDFAALTEAEEAIYMMYVAIEKLSGADAEAKVDALTEEAITSYHERRKKTEETTDQTSTLSGYLDKKTFGEVNRRFQIV